MDSNNDQTKNQNNAPATETNESAAVAQPVPAQTTPVAAKEGQKNFLTAWLLSHFLGALGADRFYLGYTGLGVLKLVTLGGCGLWALIDLILIWTGSMKASDGTELVEREKNLKLVAIIFIATVALWIVLEIVSSLIES